MDKLVSKGKDKAFPVSDGLFKQASLLSFSICAINELVILVKLMFDGEIIVSFCFYSLLFIHTSGFIFIYFKTRKSYFLVMLQLRMDFKSTKLSF